MKKDSKSVFPFILTTTIILLALGAAAFLLFKDTTPPAIAIGPDATDIGKGGKITVSVSDPGSGLKSLSVVAEQNGKSIPLIQKEYPAGTVQVEEEISLADGMVKEGAFTVTASAKDTSLYPFGTAGKSSAQKSFAYDGTPPRIFVETHTNNLNQGGAGFLVYSLSEEVDHTGVSVGERFFPGHLQQSGNGTFRYYCLFAHPWDTPVKDFKPFIVASDKAGNESKRPFNYHTNAKAFRKDRINLSDSFMERTIPEFQGLVPDKGTLLDRYLYINNTLRKENRAKLVEFSHQTSPTMLWSGIFRRLPNAANRARFADARDYMYNGKKVDQQTHLGLDLASIRHAPVPAGNNGTVVYADFLGIYGNVVVLDHGLGLQTLYAHLSSIDVKTGDTVSKGDIIAHTGFTGLAGGDHLHYGVTVAGIPVQPIEWWDASWIKHNVTSKMD
ncbi:peptidoglycan DD-metalloendopeptidase family protein [Pseudodesulfovibrio cashew]|uniref:Peptidoglycan DD-metalloendopeptidase family protein n=1 Tax=Pseudodesulfovibrio cashew TaxID=2678688 RepID=A0A6I6JM66_9BACT|nr:M23 family metallopeptidase [Pseudodesulfovibrio cashew]QGY41382.1 peptidoglycan DD-metalloendopeptidase family protein [Pseudodesulfovibrio cashew]